MTKRTCSIEGCGSPITARGWCRRHYLRWYQHGTPDAPDAPSRYDDPEEAFAARTEQQGSCLIWTGSTGTHGYGRMSDGGKRVAAHRYAWEREHGPIPKHSDVDHICWNRACVNVEHLRLATRMQNQANRSGAQANSKTGVRGVRKRPHGYEVAVKADGKRHYFGTYPTLEQATEAAKEARKALMGDFSGR